jgi:hypothetical protein
MANIPDTCGGIESASVGRIYAMRGEESGAGNGRGRMLESGSEGERRQLSRSAKAGKVERVPRMGVREREGRGMMPWREV